MASACPTRRVFTSLTTCLVAIAIVSSIFAQTAKEDEADVERLIKALEIHPGSIVGEIGAGSGELTVMIAKAVGETGRVFSNDLNRERLKDIAKAVASAGLKNVTIVDGKTLETNFADQCCDAIFMRSVYHHFADPPAVNASILKSLKPGGRVAVQDFGPPPGGESADPAGRAADGHHGVTSPTVARELKAAGFEIISASDFGFRGVFVVARKPTTGP